MQMSSQFPVPRIRLKQGTQAVLTKLSTHHEAYCSSTVNDRALGSRDPELECVGGWLVENASRRGHCGILNVLYISTLPPTGSFSRLPRLYAGCSPACESILLPLSCTHGHPALCAGEASGQLTDRVLYSITQLESPTDARRRPILP